MWQPALVAVFLLPRTILCNILEDEYELREELRSLDHSKDVVNELSPDHLRYVRHHLRHWHHGHNHRRHPFLRQSRPSLLIQADEAPVAAEKTLLSESLHPQVAKKLGQMDQAMQGLRGKQQEAAEARSTYETEVKTAIRHMNEVEAIRIDIGRTEAEIREESRKLRHFSDDRIRLSQKHRHLVLSLHHIMDPKIDFAAEQLKHSEDRLKDFEQKAKLWTAKQEQWHASSIAMIEERHAQENRLVMARAAEARAHQEVELAKKQYQADKKVVSENVLNYRYALAHAKAAKSQEEQGKEGTVEAKVAAKRLGRILALEERRVNEAMAIGKDRLQGKIRELERIKTQSGLKLSQMMQSYGQWQKTQQMWAKQLVSRKETTSAVSKEFVNQQQAVVDAAKASVVYDAGASAEPGSRRDDWAWGGWPDDSDEGDTDFPDAA